MAYRTSRAFRGQFRILTLIAELEVAEEAAARNSRLRWRQRRAQRRQISAQTLLAAALSEPSLRAVAGNDLLPRVREYMEREPAIAAPPSAATSRQKWVNLALAVLCLAVWLTVLAEVAAGGISNRISFTLLEALALALTLVTALRLLRAPTRSKPNNPDPIADPTAAATWWPNRGRSSVPGD